MIGMGFSHVSVTVAVDFTAGPEQKLHPKCRHFHGEIEDKP